MMLINGIMYNYTSMIQLYRKTENKSSGIIAWEPLVIISYKDFGIFAYCSKYKQRHNNKYSQGSYMCKKNINRASKMTLVLMHI